MTSSARVTAAPNSTSSWSMFVAVPDLLEQAGVVDGARRHVGEALDQGQVLGVVARHVVGELEDADHLVAHHERRRELRLVAPLLEGAAADRREHRVVEARGARDAALRDGHGAAGVLAQRARGALPGGVEGAVVVAHQGAQELAFDGVDVGDRCVRQARQAARDALEDVAAGQPRDVFAGFDEHLQIAVARLEGGDRSRVRLRGRGARPAAVCARGRPVAQQGVDVGAPVAPMAPGAAIADELAGVAPAAQRVLADAEQLGGRTEPQPASIVARRRKTTHGTPAGRLCLKT